MALDAEYTTITVNSKVYEVPIPNGRTREDFYMVKKALAGDSIAREMLLGLGQEKKIYIGDVDFVRWLVLRKDNEEVIEYAI